MGAAVLLRFPHNTVTALLYNEFVNPLLQVKRKRKIVWEGHVTSLRRVKENVETVEQGNECGVGCKEFNGWQEGDSIEAFRLVEKKRTLEDAAVPASAAAQE